MTTKLLILLPFSLTVRHTVFQLSTHTHTTLSFSFSSPLLLIPSFLAGQSANLTELSVLKLTLVIVVSLQIFSNLNADETGLVVDPQPAGDEEGEILFVRLMRYH